MKSIKWIYLFFAFLLSLTGNGQERVYLHFDQSGYFLEETMWCKAYVVDVQSRVLTKKSEVLYVELLSPEGYVVKSMKYKLKDGMCDGHIKLHRTIHSGFYEVRAYTRYMLNFGTDNYYTRVFPVYDEVCNGAYHIQRMLIRKRGIKPNKVFPEKVECISNKNDTVIRNLNICVTDTIIRPFQKISLEIKGRPDDVFSLSVVDASSRLFANYKSDISELNSSKRENIFASESFIVPPEKDITIIGKVVKKKFKFGYGDVEALIPNTHLQFSMETPDNSYSSIFKTDSSGYFMLSLGDFYGDYLGNVRAMSFTIDDKDVAVCIDKWFSPPPRLYNENEIFLLGERKVEQTTGKEQSSTEKELPELVVKQRKRRRGWMEFPHSMLSLNVAEEIEWYRDHYPGSPLNLFGFIPALFERYDYPVGHVRFLLLEGTYEGDSIVPVSSHLFDNPTRQIPLSKRMIIRTDKEICNAYSYKKRKPENRTSNESGKSSFITSFGPSTAPQEGLPNYIICFEPFTDEEKSNRQHLIYNNVATNRYTVIKGYSQSIEYIPVDYSVSYPKSDFRRTLYWNPSVRTDSSGVARIEFYNNSTCRELHISAEGIGGDMKPIIYKSN